MRLGSGGDSGGVVVERGVAVGVFLAFHHPDVVFGAGRLRGRGHLRELLLAQVANLAPPEGVGVLAGDGLVLGEADVAGHHPLPQPGQPAVAQPRVAVQRQSLEGREEFPDVGVEGAEVVVGQVDLGQALDRGHGRVGEHLDEGLAQPGAVHHAELLQARHLGQEVLLQAHPLPAHVQVQEGQVLQVPEGLGLHPLQGVVRQRQRGQVAQRVEGARLDHPQLVAAEVERLEEAQPQEGSVLDAVDLVVLHGQVVQPGGVGEQPVLDDADSVGVHVQLAQVVGQPPRDVDQLVVPQPDLVQVVQLREGAIGHEVEAVVVEGQQA